MTALIKTVKSRFMASPFPGWYGKIGNVIDCIVPIALVVVVLVASGLMAFGFIQ